MPEAQPAAPQAKAQTGQPMAPLTILERTAGIQLNNRFIWLVLFAALYLIGQLSYVQWQTGTAGHPRFDTLDLMSLIMVIIEIALLLNAPELHLARVRAHRLALTEDLGGDALPDVALRTAVHQQRLGGPRQHVDESGRYRQPSCIDLNIRVSLELSDRDNSIRLDPNVRDIRHAA